MKAGNSGMSLIELTVVVAVAALVGTLGSRQLSQLGRQLQQQYAAAAEREVLGGLEHRFQRRWEERLSHRFLRQSWMRVEGRPDGGSWDLERFGLMVCSPEGNPLWWELARDGPGWREVIRGLDPDSEPLAAFTVPYTGRILISTDMVTGLPGEEPTRLHWRFPDAATQRGQFGFAICGNCR